MRSACTEPDFWAKKGGGITKYWYFLSFCFKLHRRNCSRYGKTESLFLKIVYLPLKYCKKILKKTSFLMLWKFFKIGPFSRLTFSPLWEYTRRPQFQRYRQTKYMFLNVRSSPFKRCNYFFITILIFSKALATASHFAIPIFSSTLKLTNPTYFDKILLKNLDKQDLHHF